MMRLQAVLSVLRGIAPEHLAEPWDHVGLQVGDPQWRVGKALLCIDLTAQVLEEAIQAGASLVVAYHPPIFEPLTAVTSMDPKERLILEAVRRKIAIYSPHTALDAAAGGVNDWLCDGLGDGMRRPIRLSQPDGAVRYKLVTFVPHDYADGLRLALATAGAGQIGEYSHCSYGVAGEGTFRGGAKTKPAVGKPGRLERVAELRLEMVCPASRIVPVIAALRQAHPYEEPAFDLYRLESTPPQDQGQGRVLTLDRPLTANTLIKRVKDHLGVQRLDVAAPTGLTRIGRIGLCAGAGGSLLSEAGDVDAFITGEMRHHDVLAARSGGVMVVLAGHTQTERPYLKQYRRRIVSQGGGWLEWMISRADRPPSRLR